MMKMLEITGTTCPGNQPQVMFLNREAIVSYYVQGENLVILTAAGPIYTKEHTHTSFTLLLKGDSLVEVAPPRTPPEPPKQHPQQPQQMYRKH